MIQYDKVDMARLDPDKDALVVVLPYTIHPEDKQKMAEALREQMRWGHVLLPHGSRLYSVPKGIEVRIE